MKLNDIKEYSKIYFDIDHDEIKYNNISYLRYKIYEQVYNHINYNYLIDYSQLIMLADLNKEGLYETK